MNKHLTRSLKSILWFSVVLLAIVVAVGLSGPIFGLPTGWALVAAAVAVPALLIFVFTPKRAMNADSTEQSAKAKQNRDGGL